MSKADMLTIALDDLLAVSPDIEAAAVVSGDGLPMASALPEHVHEDRLAAMSAALLTLGEKAASGLGKGGLSQVFVEGELGYVVLMAAGDNSVLVVVTSKESKVGLVLFEMRKSSTRISEVMRQDEAVEGPPAPEHETWGTSSWDAPPAPQSMQQPSNGFGNSENAENVSPW
jgi:predicted regulator of Ras-like GTPase activity (Roadblock/LC7/MglB family)